MRRPRPVEVLKGYSLRARDGEIGSVQEVFFDDESRTVRCFVVRTAGWLRGREVLTAPRSVTVVDDAHCHIGVDLVQLFGHYGRSLPEDAHAERTSAAIDGNEGSNGSRRETGRRKVPLRVIHFPANEQTADLDAACGASRSLAAGRQPCPRHRAIVLSVVLAAAEARKQS